MGMDPVAREVWHWPGTKYGVHRRKEKVDVRDELHAPFARLRLNLISYRWELSTLTGV